MKRIRRIIRPMLCMAVLLFAMTTAVMGCYQKDPDTVAWLYIPGAEVDDPVMQAEDNGYYLKLDENGEYAMWCTQSHGR